MQFTSSDSHVSIDVIRTGSDRRLCFSPGQRPDLLYAFERSGLTDMAFVSQHLRKNPVK